MLPLAVVWLSSPEPEPEPVAAEALALASSAADTAESLACETALCTEEATSGAFSFTVSAASAMIVSPVLRLGGGAGWDARAFSPLSLMLQVRTQFK